MRIFKLKRLVSLTLVAVSCGSAVPFVAFADDSKGEPPAKRAAAAKIEAPAPLTERERWLLDRVEQLEKRVTELEAKTNPPALAAASAPVPQPAAENAENPPASGAPGAEPAPAAPASTNAIAASSVVASLGTQATEKGKSGAAKPAAAEPFAFADFTWLNGNARTKEVPLDTKFFT